MRKSISIILTIIICLSMFLSGCSKQKDGSQGSNKGSTIKFATFYSEEQEEIYKEIIKKYEEKNPGTKVELISDYSDEQKIKDSLTENGDIDVIGLKRNQIIEFAKSGLLNDMTSLVESEGLERKLYEISTAYGSYNGKVYGIGDMPMTIEWFYNTDIFDRLHLTEPKNIEDLIKVCKKIKADGITPIAIGGMDEWTLASFFGMITAQTTGSSDFTKNYASDIGSFSNISGINKAFDIYGRLAGSCIPRNSNDINYAKSIEEFVMGKAAILPAGSWAINKIDETKPNGFHYQVFKSPVNFVESPVSTYSATAGQVLSIPVKSNHTKEAQEFIKFLFSEEAQRIFVDKGYNASLISVNTEENSVRNNILSHLEMTDDNSIMLLDNLEPKMAENTSRILQDILADRLKPEEGWNKILEMTFPK